MNRFSVEYNFAEVFFFLRFPYFLLEIAISALTYSYGVSVAFVVDAELPEPLVGGAARVSVLHPEVRCRGNDEKHQGSHAAEGAPSRQSVEHRGEAVERSVLLSIQQLVGTQNVIDPSLIIRTKLIRMPTESNLFVLLAFTESVFFFSESCFKSDYQ